MAGKLKLILFFVFLTIQLLGATKTLSKADVRPAMQEMFSYHVEYKKLSPLLIRRSFKIYIEQFDPERIYLLSGEASQFWEMDDAQIDRTIRNYQSDNLSSYENGNKVIQKAILRVRAMREEIERELIIGTNDPSDYRGESYLTYPSDEQEQRQRLRKQLIRILLVERQASGYNQWTPAQREKVFALWEKRFRRVEDTYLANSDHYLALHILKAMAKSLDAHTAYFSPEEAFEMRVSLEKQFEGIGVVLREGIDGVMITDLIKGAPAERSGKLVAGDVIVSVDGKSMEKASYEEILSSLKGQGQQKLNLGVKRTFKDGQSEIVKVDLKREKILMDEDRVHFTTEPFADGYIGKIVLPAFYESDDNSSCEKDLKEALFKLKSKGKIYGIVLDMRENSGGFLNQAVKVAGLFIKSGIVVISKYAQGEVQYLRDLDAQAYYNGPLVILTSRASASAAEIVAQALQDYGAALIVGDERTYGKGTIQYQTVTDPSATSYFKVTVGKYYTVSGRSTQIDGVRADITVPTFYTAYNIGERFLEYPLKNDRVSPFYVDPLTDIDQRSQSWFKKNYLPNLQQKETEWISMVPSLKENTSYRLSHDPDFQIFMQQIQSLKAGKDRDVLKNSTSPKVNWGQEDLHMAQAVSILKDMVEIKADSAKK